MSSSSTIDVICREIRETQATARRVHELRAENARLRHTLRRIANTAGRETREPNRPPSTRTGGDMMPSKRREMSDTEQSESLTRYQIRKDRGQLPDCQGPGHCPTPDMCADSKRCCRATDPEQSDSLSGLAHEDETRALALIGAALLDRAPLDTLTRLLERYERFGDPFADEQTVLRGAIGRRS